MENYCRERELRKKGGGKFNVMENFCLLYCFFFEYVCGLIMNKSLGKFKFFRIFDRDWVGLEEMLTSDSYSGTSF
jgi:hypothetical protein